MDDYKNTPGPRHVLPTLRLTETRRIETCDGQTIYLSVGFDPCDPERPREVFYSAGFKSGSQLEIQIQDDCVLLSFLMQYGLRPEDVAKSLARNEQPDGSMARASIIGLIVDEVLATEP
jgi:hypothetical protein